MSSLFTKLSSRHIKYFTSLLPEHGVIQEADRLQAFNTDWTGKFKGSSKLLLRPKDTTQVEQIIQYCHEEKLALTPQGGNTGLVGGGVPVFDEIILSLSAMNKIISFDDQAGVLVCEAGCVLEDLEKFVEAKGFTIPLDLGAKGSCQIGGNVSTNAGGLRLLRYGSLHGNVLGLEAVTPHPGILDNLNTLRKDNTGYDLKHLFIGSEGTLGVVTKVALLTPKKSLSKNVMILGLESFEKVKETFNCCKDLNGEILSAYEFWDHASSQVTLDKLQHVRNPLEQDQKYPFYVLIETSGSNQDHDADKLTRFFEYAMEKGLVKDGVLAQDSSQMMGFWKFREGIPEACIKAGSIYKYDISLPLSHLYEIVEKMRKEPCVIDKNALVVGFGHLGDGNLHLNIMAGTSYDKEFSQKIDAIIYDYTGNHGGSISAEHGIGQLKRSYLHRSKTLKMIDSMKSLKRLFDPHGIMNPYKVLPL